MERSTPTDSTSSDAVRIIANDDIAEAGEIIDDMKNLEEKQSNEEISETEKTIKDLQSFLLMNRKSKCGGACYCCFHNNKMNEYIYLFLEELMKFEVEKFGRLRHFFSRQDEKKHCNR